MLKAILDCIHKPIAIFLLILCCIGLALPGGIRVADDLWANLPNLSSYNMELKHDIKRMDTKASHVQKFINLHKRLPSEEELNCITPRTEEITLNPTCSNYLFVWGIFGSVEHFKMSYSRLGFPFAPRTLNTKPQHIVYDPPSKQSNYDHHKSMWKLIGLFCLQLLCNISIMLAPVIAWLKLRKRFPYLEAPLWWVCFVFTIPVAIIIPNII